MSLAVKEATETRLFGSEKVSQMLGEGDTTDLVLAKSRMNDEFTSGEEYRYFLNKLIDESYSSKKSL